MLVGDVGSCTTHHVFQFVEDLFAKEITFFDFIDYNFPPLLSVFSSLSAPLSENNAYLCTRY